MELTFLDSSQDLSTALHADYILILVALSYLAACMAAYAAWGMSDLYSYHRSRPARFLWLGGGAFAMGCGIWAMHFLAMLAYQLPIPVAYDMTGTLLSVLPAILASGVAIYIFSHEQLGFRRMAAGGVIFGAGIGTMHYSGMAAMRIDALMVYDKYLFTLSILVAVVLAYFSLWLNYITKRYEGSFAYGRVKGLSIAMMGLAVAGMHYMGMTAVYFFPHSGQPRNIEGLEPLALSLLVILITGLIMGLGILTSFFQRRLIFAHQTMEASQMRLNSAINSISDGFVLFDREDKLVMTNNVFRDMYEGGDEWIKPGVSYRTLVEQQAQNLTSESNGNREYLDKRLHWHKNPIDVFNETLVDGRSVIGKENRADTGDLVGTWTDISKIKEAEARLRESREQIKRILELSPSATLIRNLKTNAVLYFNKKAEDYYQARNFPLVIGQTNSFIDSNEIKTLMKDLRVKGELYNTEVQFYTQGGEVKTILFSAVIVAYENQAAAIISFLDITERKTMEENLLNLAQTDPLTGVFNRRYFSSMGIREFTRCRRNQLPLSLIMLDIDNFKRINDTHGHDVGDEAIKILCDLCRENLRDVEILARVGGEEFAIIIPDKDLDTCQHIAQRIRRVIEENVITLGDNPDEKKISYTVSIGICELKADHQDFEALIKCADVALYKAKENGRNQIQMG